MVETSVRHPKLYALLAGAVSLVAAVALIGPADGGPVGVDAASATSPDTSETIPSPPTSDDGVVLTAPGELVEVFVPPSTSEDVEVTGATPAARGFMRLRVGWTWTHRRLLGHPAEVSSERYSELYAWSIPD